MTKRKKEVKQKRWNKEKERGVIEEEYQRERKRCDRRRVSKSEKEAQVRMNGRDRWKRNRNIEVIWTKRRVRKRVTKKKKELR